MRRLVLALFLSSVVHVAPSLADLPGSRVYAGDEPELLWLAAAPDGNGGALLRYTAAPDDFLVVAGAASHTAPRAAWRHCYDGDIAPILAAARARGRIEHLELSRQSDVHELKVWFDDLGSPMQSFRYHCGPDGMSPLRGAGGTGHLTWIAVGGAAILAGLGGWWYRRGHRASPARA